MCRRCIDKLYEHYCTVLGDDDEAIRRICMKFDIYYNQSLADASRKISAERSRIHTYVSRANLIQYKDNTYDTTLEEESRATIESVEEVRDSKKVTQKTVKFFGLGFTEEEYRFLQDQYDDWTARHECKTKAQEEIFKAICMSQLSIQRANQSGDPRKVELAMKAFQELLGTAAIKPTQTNDNTFADQNTFGTLIQKWENERPIPEPDPEFEDVDGIRRYVSAYFLGHLCKMMGIKNRYSAIYEEEMAKYTVKKPSYEQDEVDPEISMLFEGETHGSA